MKFLYLFFIVLLFFTFCLSQTNRGFINKGFSPQEELQPGKYYALVIAIQSYTDPKITSLDQPISDATRLIKVLKSEYNFKDENIYFRQNPTAEELSYAFDSLSQLISPADNLLIFYAGHGYWDEKKEQGYWLPSDAKRDNRAKWVSNSDLRDQIRGLKTKHTLLISDACFSGGIFKTRAAFENTPPAISELYRNASRKAITSGAMKEVPDKSVFVEYLIKKLDDNRDPYLASQKLFIDMREVVINNSRVNQTPQYGTIAETGDEGGDFIFFKPSAVQHYNTLVVAVNMEDADILLNGKYLGKSNPLWQEQKVTPGRNTIEVRKQGYASIKKEVDVPESGEFRVNVNLEMLRLADITVDVGVPNAGLYVDGKLAGSSSGKNFSIKAKELPWGEHLVEVEASGYKRYQQKIMLSENKEYPLSVTLKQNSGLLAFRGMTASKIFLNDKYVADAPTKELEVPVGVYEVRLSQRGYEDYTQDVTMFPDKQMTINYRLTQKTTSTALTRSLVFPGRGQFYQDRGGMGFIYSGLFIGALAATGYFQNDLNIKTDAYNVAYEDYTNERTLALVAEKKAALKNADDKLTSATSLRNFALISIGAVYVLNALDVILFAPDWKSSPAKIDLSYRSYNNGTITLQASMNL